MLQGPAVATAGAGPLTIDPAAFELLTSLLIGFAFAGLLASAFELFTARRADFRLLQAGGLVAVASVPVVVFSAPFLILRNTVRGRRIEGRLDRPEEFELDGDEFGLVTAFRAHVDPAALVVRLPRG